MAVYRLPQQEIRVHMVTDVATVCRAVDAAASGGGRFFPFVLVCDTLAPGLGQFEYQGIHLHRRGCRRFEVDTTDVPGALAPLFKAMAATGNMHRIYVGSGASWPLLYFIDNLLAESTFCRVAFTLDPGTPETDLYLVVPETLAEATLANVLTFFIALLYMSPVRVDDLACALVDGGGVGPVLFEAYRRFFGVGTFDEFRRHVAGAVVLSGEDITRIVALIRDTFPESWEELAAIEMRRLSRQREALEDTLQLSFIHQDHHRIRLLFLSPSSKRVVGLPEARGTASL